MKIKVFEFDIYGTEDTRDIEEQVNAFIKSEECVRVEDIKTNVTITKVFEKNNAIASKFRSVLIYTIFYESSSD